MTTDASNRPRRWRWQFGLRGFLLLMAAVAAVGGTIGSRFYYAHRRQLALDAISRNQGSVVYTRTAPREPERVYLNGPQIDDAVLADLVSHLQYLPTIKELDLVNTSPDGQILASGSRDDTIRLWDLTTGELLHVLAGHTDDVLKIAFSPNGQRLASASYDETVRLWDMPTGEPNGVLHGHRDRVFAVVFSPNGAEIASGGTDGLLLWNVASQALIRSWPEQTLVAAVAFDPKGTQLASSSANGDVLIRSLPTGRLLHVSHDEDSQHLEIMIDMAVADESLESNSDEAYSP